MTPYGKALAAHVHWRLGDKAKGNNYLDRALDGSREDEIAVCTGHPKRIHGSGTMTLFKRIPSLSTPCCAQMMGI
mgnify:FL=1